MISNGICSTSTPTSHISPPGACPLTLTPRVYAPDPSLTPRVYASHPLSPPGCMHMTPFSPPGCMPSHPHGRGRGCKHLYKLVTDVIGECLCMCVCMCVCVCVSERHLHHQNNKTRNYAFYSYTSDLWFSNCNPDTITIH